jgi:hypothetical protein
MGRALLGLYDATREQRVLDALIKVYAEYPVPMGTLELGGEVSGLCNLDPMLETYSFSGDHSILEHALKALKQPEISRSIQNWREEKLQPGHMVILYENIRLPAAAYPWSGDSDYLQATIGAFRWLDKHHILPYGVASGEEFGSGIGALRKTETCDVAAMLHSTWWMFRIQGDSQWGDRMAQAFFNAGPGPVARDFKTMCYYQSPNRLRSDSLPIEQPVCPGPPNTRFTGLGCSNVLCCVGALNRVLPEYIVNMWAATWDNGLAATLYGPCKVSARIGEEVAIHITSVTDYPFKEDIQLKIDPERPVNFPMYLRIPTWCQGARIKVNNSSLATVPNENGFVKITRKWSKGDKVDLHFPMNARLIEGFETEFPAGNLQYFGFEPKEVFQPRKLPYASVLYGPLLFALPIAELDPNTPDGNAQWQYAMDTKAIHQRARFKVMRKAMPAHWNWPLDGPVTVSAPARRFDWHPTDGQALPQQAINEGEPKTIELVPYGCTKFRISMFPVTSEGTRTAGLEP